MRIDNAQIYNQSTNKYTSKKPISTNDKVSDSQDTVEFSQEGLDNLKSTKDYDLAKVMEIHKKGFSQIPTKEESDYYWNARKNDPALDAKLYSEDKANALEVVGKVQSILMKALSGQPLTPEEEAMVKDDPALAQEVEMRKSQAQMWKTK